jgi:hypothetical protein
MRIQLSPLPRVAEQVPQTHSAFLSASSIVGKSFGSFCKSASRVAMHRPRDWFLHKDVFAPFQQFAAHIEMRRGGRDDHRSVDLRKKRVRVRSAMIFWNACGLQSLLVMICNKSSTGIDLRTRR